MRKPPAFQFYADDFLGGTCDMTQTEIGAYILLLCHQWNRGSIPVEPERQANVAKGPVSPHVLAKFKPGPDGSLRNDRLESERQKQNENREKQRQKGLASGVARSKSREPLLNTGSTVVQPSMEPNRQPKGNSPSPSPSSSIKTCSTKGPSKGRDLTPAQKDIADTVEEILGNEWMNDAGKWLNRITGGRGDAGNAIKAEPMSVRDVFAEVADAIKHDRITGTPAAYAEFLWKEKHP